ncbi:probable LRR receptor-like serine/threonine-protein kinase At2g23950 [Durio zibethinus]|uniref:Probable LRR receptor-like serine/threonine-protein kinase At2g23950 n=1 Tax=Durio zibethinus TaxID=66656 RepID=A0A6P5WY21_DURZI|nr:probable LRR receptor-like serine/threonine-protein kinase At2g23950 [Durio zibethinus]
MASTPSTCASVLLFFITLLSSVSATVVDDLANLHPPSDFNTTIISNCMKDTSLRYCSSSPTAMDLNEIFRFTIVASHLCNESKNPNCVESFPKIDLRSRPKITPLYLSFSFFWKYCPITILSINLSNNSLKGSFPTDVLLCTQIQALDLSHNDLSGDVPIQSFSPLTNLTLLNLSYNQFSESKISDSQFFKRFNSSSFLNSGLLPNHQEYRVKAVILLLGFPIVVILMVGCLWWLCFRRPDFLPKALQNKHKFTNSMLKAATNGFSKKNKVGKSEGFAIYRGILRDGTEVRIEIYLNNVISRENRRKFVQECKVLVQLCHKNLVKVYGWCSNRTLSARVTEWTGEESVEMWLSESAPSWKLRLKVLVGVLKGMCYLQEQWPEVDYDLRTSGVLIHQSTEPLIARFKVGENSSRKKIYRFGVFLLEMMTNGRLGKEFEGSEAGFFEYVKTQYPGNLLKVIDERMKLTENTFDQAKQAIGIGLTCTDHSTNRHLRLGQISNMITRIYESCLVLASQNHSKSRAKGGRTCSHNFHPKLIYKDPLYRLWINIFECEDRGEPVRSFVLSNIEEIKADLCRIRSHEATITESIYEKTNRLFSLKSTIIYQLLLIGQYVIDDNLHFIQLRFITYAGIAATYVLSSLFSTFGNNFSRFELVKVRLIIEPTQVEIMTSLNLTQDREHNLKIF